MSGYLQSPDELVELLGIPFSSEQLTAITAPLAPGVIIAGAGTGKTTVMAARVVWLVATGQLRPDQVLGLTFTRKAALELSQRVDEALVKADLVDPDHVADEGRQLITTYDSFASRLISEHGLRIGVEADQILITGATRYRLAAQAVAGTGEALPGLCQWQPATVADRLLKLDAELRSHLVDSAEVLAEDQAFAQELQAVKPGRGGRPTAAVRTATRTTATRAELLGLIDDYRRLKHDRGFTEFADQMAQAVRLLDASPEVTRQLRERFGVVLLDEYQDTSAAQAHLLQRLFSGPDTARGLGFPVTAVGDPFQAIYGWRGAAPSNILQFCDDFPNADGSPAARFTLSINRRSKPVILDLANQLAEPLRADRRLLGDGVSPQQRLLRAPDDSRGGIVRAASFDTWPQEVEWLADQVLAARRTGQVTDWSQIAVLTRTNSPIGAIFEALVSRDVPVEIVGLGGLLEVPEIADVVATLQLIDDVTANPEVVRLLSGPRWRIGPRDLAVVGSRARELLRASQPPGRADGGDALADIGEQFEPAAQLCLMDAVEDLGSAPVSDDARRRLAAFAAELRDLRRHRDEPLLELVHRVIDSSGISLELSADVDLFNSGRRRQLERFADAVGEYIDIDGDGALSGLLAWFRVEREEGRGLDQAVPSSDESVKLLTVHRSKGLEWDLVFLPGLCEGTFPSTQPADNWTTQAAVLPAALRGDAPWVPQLAEVSSTELSKVYPGELKAAQRQAEDRLIYVGVTRARSQLVASCHYWFPGRKTAKAPSDYFRTLCDAGSHIDVAAQMSEANPLLGVELRHRWPVPIDEAKLAALSEAAQQVRQAQETDQAALVAADADAQQHGDAWHALGEMLIAAEHKRRQPRSEVTLPASVSASALMMANRDRAAFASQVLRPMPRPVSQRTSVGTRFHEWLEKRFDMIGLLDDDFDSEPEAEPGGTADQLFRSLTDAFEQGCYAERTPVCIEEPFILTIGAQQVRGRMDAVFATPEDDSHDYQVVDWKTSNAPADPLQLSIYRLAWARSLQLPLDRVDAVFYHVLTDRVEAPPLLDERAMGTLVADLATQANLDA